MDDIRDANGRGTIGIALSYAFASAASKVTLNRITEPCNRLHLGARILAFVSVRRSIYRRHDGIHILVVFGTIDLVFAERPFVHKVGAKRSRRWRVPQYEGRWWAAIFSGR